MLFSLQPQPGAHGTFYLLIHMHMVSTMLDSRLFLSEMVLSSFSNAVNPFLKKEYFHHLSWHMEVSAVFQNGRIKIIWLFYEERKRGPL